MKKNLTLLCIAVCSYGIAQAQIENGTILIGGEIFVSNVKDTYPPGFQNTNAKANYTQINITPGLAVKDNSVLGINFNYTFSNQTNVYLDDQYGTLKENNYSPGLFFRHYKKLFKDFYFFGDVTGNYIYGTLSLKDTSGIKTVSGKTNGAQIVFTPGFSYKVFKRWFIELSFPNILGAAYQSTKVNDMHGVSSEKRFLFLSNLNGVSSAFLGVGFKYFIPGKKSD